MAVFGVPGMAPGEGGVSEDPVFRAGTEGRAEGRVDGDIDTVFVFGGGGNRGAAQVGMLRALTERSIVPDLLVGTSIGAINAAAFASYPSIEGVYYAAEVWRRIAAEHVFPRSRFHGSWRFLERREAVFANEGLAKVITGFLRFEELEDSKTPLVVVATRVEDGAECWLSEGSALDAILASSALPGLFPPVEIDGNHYIDGGVVDNVPITAGLAAGPRRIFVLLCGPVGSSGEVASRPYEAIVGAFGIALHARLRRDLASIPDDVDAVVLAGPPIDSVDLDDFSKTDELIDAGYQTARLVLDGYEATLAERRSDRFGRQVRWLADKRPGRRDQAG